MGSTKTIDDVVKFARARHRIWEGKGTKSRILTTRKFTNVFRVLDRGSQYLLELMDLHDEARDRLAVSYLYRQVNRPDTMNAIIEKNGGYVPSFDEVTNAAWIKETIWPVIKERPGEFLSGVYIILIMTNDPRSLAEKMADIFPGARNHLEHVAEVDHLATRVMLLQETRGLGPFLSMQIATDLGYCEGERDQENTFILPGPGARKGVGHLLGKTHATEREAREIIQNFPVERLPALPGSNGRPASWMDVQNVFCEFSKYVRFLEKPVPPTATPYRRNGEFEVRIPQHFIQG